MKRHKMAIITIIIRLLIDIITLAFVKKKKKNQIVYFISNLYSNLFLQFPYRGY